MSKYYPLLLASTSAPKSSLYVAGVAELLPNCPGSPPLACTSSLTGKRPWREKGQGSSARGDRIQHIPSLTDLYIKSGTWCAVDWPPWSRRSQSKVKHFSILIITMEQLWKKVFLTEIWVTIKGQTLTEPYPKLFNNGPELKEKTYTTILYVWDQV